MNTPDKPKPAPMVDWEAIERDYRAGVMTLRQIAQDRGVSHVAIDKRAKKLGWSRDLAAKIQAKAEELVNKTTVNSPLTEAQVILENGAQTAAVRLGHRKDIGRLRAIIAEQLTELEASSGTGQANRLRELGDLLREPDEFNRDKLNDIYRAVISLPERSKVAKQLAETLRIAVDLERREFGMDKLTADDPFASMLRSIGQAASAFRPVAVDPAYLGLDDDE